MVIQCHTVVKGISFCFRVCRKRKRNLGRSGATDDKNKSEGGGWWRPQPLRGASATAEDTL